VSPAKTERLTAQRDDVVDLDTELGGAWRISIKCIFDDGVQEAKSTLTLDPKNPHLSRADWSAAYDGKRLRLETR
jgi:hypothetical protein